MANRMKGEATFAHEGAEHTLVINMDVLLQAEDETGVGILEVVGSSRMGWLGSLLRHALHAGGGKLLPRGEAAELIMKSDTARDALKTAFNAAMPQADEGATEGNG